MRTRRFGTTDLVTSEIAFGTWALGSDWWGQTDDPDRLIGRALELGISLFDTGDAYGQGLNEQLVGRALATVPRDRVQIATKFGYLLDDERREHREGERPQDFSPTHARRALEQSLSRLGTDFVDLYQLHNPRMSAIENEELFAELEALKQQGKLLHYGVALGPAIGWRDEGLAALARHPITSLQTVYNLLEQEPGNDFLARASDTGAGVMARVPTSSGLLEDKYTSDTTFSGNDHRRHRPREWLTEGLKKIDRLRFLVIEGERTMAQAALQFILAQPGAACVVPTVTTTAELEEFAAAPDCPDLTASELGRVAQLYASGFDLAPAGT